MDENRRFYRHIDDEHTMCVIVDALVCYADKLKEDGARLERLAQGYQGLYSSEEQRSKALAEEVEALKGGAVDE